MTGRELIRKLDDEVSLHVRLAAADDNGWIVCPTCGTANKWDDGMDWSHCIGRANYNVRWDLRNCIAQCARENRNLYRQSENAINVLDVLIGEWGEDEIEQMKALAKLPNKRPDDEWLRMTIDEYRVKNKMLRKEKGL